MHPVVIGKGMTFSELCRKEVVNVCDGTLLGCVCDLEFDLCSGNVRAIILPGSGIFAAVSSKNRITVPWRDVERIGDDAIIVRYIDRGKT